MNFEVVYSAAHAEFPDTEPLGGGKAVADYLIWEWTKDAPFALTVLSPTSLGFNFDMPLAQMREKQYARFCRAFELATTTEILKREPLDCVVLSNDISEGPNFATLGARGYRMVSIWHVDVVEYFTKFYLRDLVRPAALAKFRWFSLLPDVLKLVFQKQFECVKHSAWIVVPSAPMRETILRCYPWCQPQKIVVLPWGDISLQDDAARPPSSEMDRRDACPTIGEDEFVIMTLSRLSPEKGIEWLLKALRNLDTPTCKLRVLICGAPAYMKGQRYAAHLRRLAAQLKHIRVEFPGHVTGAQKAALLRRADLFVSPSRHESYGLTIAEASSAGCPVISHAHYGASGIVVDCSQSLVLTRVMAEVIAAGRKPRTIEAKKRAPGEPTTAERLTELLVRAHDS